MIPKIIHYCWLSNDEIPVDLQQYMETWKTKLPDYEFIKWDFTKFDKTSSIWVSEAFDNKKYALAADYIRLYAIYNYGGIYLDMDVEVLKSFNTLLNRPYMFAEEGTQGKWIEAGCFGAEKGNEFIKLCLMHYEDRHFVKTDGTFDMLSLPKVMGKICEENHIELSLYPWNFFTAKSYETGIESPDSDTYAIHHFAGSWQTEEERETIELLRKYVQFLGVRVGFNLAQYQVAAKRNGINGIVKLTKEKLKKVFKRVFKRGDRN